MVTGFETSATTISFTLAELAINHEIQNKLRQEILANLDDAGRITYESVNEIKYLSHVINGTFCLLKLFK